MERPKPISILNRRNYITISSSDYMKMVNKIKSSSSTWSTAGSWFGSKAKTKAKTKAKKQDQGQYVFTFSPGPKQRPKLPNTTIIKLLRMTGYVGDDPVELARGKRKRDVLRGSITKKFFPFCSLSPAEDSSSSSSPTKDSTAKPKIPANNTVNTSDNASGTLNLQDQEREQAMVKKTYDQLVERFIIIPPKDPCQTSFSYKIRAIKILINKLAETDTPSVAPSTSLVNPGLTRGDIRAFFLSLMSTKNNPPETYELSDGYLTDAERARLLLTIPVIPCNENCCEPRKPSEPRQPCGQKEKQQE